jgi:hypothetical protein
VEATDEYITRVLGETKPEVTKTPTIVIPPTLEELPIPDLSHEEIEEPKSSGPTPLSVTVTSFPP